MVGLESNHPRRSMASLKPQQELSLTALAVLTEVVVAETTVVDMTVDVKMGLPDRSFMIITTVNMTESAPSTPRVTAMPTMSVVSSSAGGVFPRAVFVVALGRRGRGGAGGGGDAWTTRVEMVGRAGVAVVVKPMKVEVVAEALTAPAMAVRTVCAAVALAVWMVAVTVMEPPVMAREMSAAATPAAVARLAL